MSIKLALPRPRLAEHHQGVVPEATRCKFRTASARTSRASASTRSCLRAAATSSSSTSSSTASRSATYPTLASTLVVETIFDFVVAGALMIWALSIGVLPTHQVYSRIPTVDWKFFLRHEHATADRARRALRRPRSIALLLGARAGRATSGPASAGFAILARPPRASRSACSCRRRSRGSSGSRRSTSS